VQRICVDMDEVMADTLAEHLRRYNQTFDEDVTPEDLAGKGLWEIAPLDRQAQLRAFLDAEDFFEVLDVIPDSQSVLEDLSSALRSSSPRRPWLCPTRSAPSTAVAAPLSLHPAHALRLLRQQDHPPRRLPDRRPAPESRSLRGPGPALYRAAQPGRNRIRPREQLARSGRVFAGVPS